MDTSDLAGKDAGALIQSIQYALDDANDFSAHHLRLSERSQDGKQEDSTALTVRLHPSEDGSTTSAALSPHSRQLDVHFPAQAISSPSTTSLLGPVVAQKLQDVFAEEQALLAELVSPNAFTAVSKKLSPDMLGSIAKRTTRTMKYAPTYHLSFSMLTASAYPSSWDIEEGAKRTLTPLLTALSRVSNFTVDIQILSYAVLPPTVQPQYSADEEAWILRPEDLGGFINAAEWPLTPSIGAGPTINFILYIAPPDQAPLLVNGSTTNSWIIPQWGGVTIFDPASLEDTTSLSAADLEPALLNFSTQLLSLLGVPTTPANSLSLRLMTLTRLRAASLLLSASSTLGSLARLAATLSSIPIPQTVATSVDSTISHLNAACTALRAGEFQIALEHARIADIEAEKAFFERSMVGQVYFPDEHKVAVYLPLMGPMAVPLLMSVLKEVVPLIRRLKKR